MRKLAIVLILLSVFITACAAPAVQPEPTQESNDIITELQEKLLQASEDVPVQRIDVSDANGTLMIFAKLSQDLDQALIGTHIKTLCETYKPIIDEYGNYSLHIDHFRDGGEKPELNYSFTTSDCATGFIINAKSGEPELTKIASLGDLANLFPVMNGEFVREETKDDTSKPSEEEIIIYDEIMAALYEDYDRPEEEILAEFADKYGKSADEIKALVDKVMEYIY